jgi:Raf kinase inhibitor-like YbhB/YbcL family protein
MKRFLFAMIVLSLALAACGPAETPAPATTVPTEAPVSPTDTPQPAATTAPETKEVVIPFELTSPAFAAGQAIPAKYTCKGENVSPALSWGDPPDGTQTLVLIVDDPDAPGGTWVHWVMFNIPADVRDLSENFPGDATLPDGSVQGITDFGKPGYGGPCPPSGTHRYFFKLYALDTTLTLDAKTKKADLEAAMDGHILAQTELMGTFSK